METVQKTKKRKKSASVDGTQTESSHLSHRHCCTEPELEFVLTWLDEISTRRAIAKRFRKGRSIRLKERSKKKSIESAPDVSFKGGLKELTAPSSKLPSDMGRTRASTEAGTEATEGSKSVSLIKLGLYQKEHLNRNNIIYAGHKKGFSGEANSIINKIKVFAETKNDDDISASFRKLVVAQHIGLTNEGNTVRKLKEILFIRPPKEHIAELENTFYSRDLVPSKDDLHRVSIPKPDMTFGYDNQNQKSFPISRMKRRGGQR
ncbi:Uu.00g074310.m01.CDS01 [Anthostomella pinea]|uniref:Uu.00g074310.m01.CDS01 n=1 Tax=Anthostomella pinea TaxID=933095 RepID=A0AAI8VVG7_9PEZI|nr:Uu.00g074310.m01.CDS01 [Anthostomella pinea]